MPLRPSLTTNTITFLKHFSHRAQPQPRRLFLYATARTMASSSSSASGSQTVAATTTTPKPQAAATPGGTQGSTERGSPNTPEALNAPAADSTAPKIDVSGEGQTVSLDALGPIVVNKDGTVARVSNWQQMTGAERETTLRVLGKRNQQRLKVLREQGVEVKGLGTQTF